jgi:hypothetical protein
LRQGKEEKILHNRTIRQKDGVIRQLTIDDLTLHVEHKKNDRLQKDITCDSTFMLDTTNEIGRNIRAKFHWVPIDTPVYLFMDNAGGHGSIATKKEYTEMLETNYNIKIIWQPPNSPDLNQLDLGAWMSIQCQVEWKHKDRQMKVDVLARTVEEVFRDFDSVKQLTKIDKKWKDNLTLTVLGKGGNDLIECKRGKNKTFADLPSIPDDDGMSDFDSDEDEVNDD